MSSAFGAAIERSGCPEGAATRGVRISVAQISILASIALGLLYFFAALRQEFTFGPDESIQWTAPTLLYLYAGAYLALEVVAVGLYWSGRPLAGVFCFNVLVAYDTLSRELLGAVVPSAHFALPALMAAIGFLVRRRRVPRLDPLLALFALQTVTFVLAAWARHDGIRGSGVLMMLAFSCCAVIYFWSAGPRDQVSRVWRHMAICLLIATTPDLFLFVLRTLEAGAMFRLNPLQKTSGANTYGTVLLLAGVGFIAIRRHSRHFAASGTWPFYAVGLLILLGGSRWQLACWIVTALLGLRMGGRAAVIAAGSAVAASLAFEFFNAEYLIRLRDLGTGLSSRIEINASAWGAFAERPWWGAGFNGWSEASLREFGRVWPVHNVILAQFVYGGVLAGTFNLIFMLAVAGRALRCYMSRSRSASFVAVALLMFVLSQQSIFYYSYAPFCVLGLALKADRCRMRIRRSG